MPAPLPDFRNLGGWLRILLGGNLLAMLWLLARNATLVNLGQEFLLIAVWVEPTLLLMLIALHVLAPWLLGLSPRLGRLLVIGLAMAITLFEQAVVNLALQLPLDMVDQLRAALWSVVAATCMLAYFSWRNAVYSPALAEARLLALTARIRPHFLFNSLNAVLGVVRHDPRRAEAALEELSDLFRAVMQENRELVNLSGEIALARQYLDLERLRLGDRLQVIWDVESYPPDTLLPPLMLQPLLENAVYHGIEPAKEPGAITVKLGVHNQRIRLVLSNPCGDGAEGHGNQMALANIRERLMLFYDLEARLDTRAYDGQYEVVIELPLRRKELL